MTLRGTKRLMHVFNAMLAALGVLFMDNFAFVIYVESRVSHPEVVSMD